MNGNTFTRIIVVFLLLGIFGIAYFYLGRGQDQVTPPETTHQTLQSTNTNYNEGNNLFAKRDYKGAIEKYNTAINNTNSSTQEVLIKMKIALAASYNRDELKAIDILKDIIDNPKYRSDLHEMKQAKASAVLELTGIFYRTHDKAVTEKIFSGKPYEDFIKKEDANDNEGLIDIAYRRLLEYASSLSSPPDLLVEAQIAKWYAVKVYRLKIKGAVTAEEEKQIKEYTNTAKSKWTYIDANYRNAQNYYQNTKTSMLPILFRQKAISFGSLMAGGDTSSGNPEEIFLEALSLPQPAWISSVTKYTYAVFLAAAYGEKRKMDIANLLSDFYSPPTGSELDWHTWLLNEKANPTRNQESLFLLASIDPKFKAFLISLGFNL